MPDPSLAYNRPAVVAVAMVVLLVILNLIVLATVQRAGGDQALAVTQADGIQAFYAAEAGQNMALAEIMKNTDTDGDGTIGSISDDGNDANDPLLNAASLRVRRSEVGASTVLTAAGRATDCRRSLRCTTLLSGAGPYFEAGSVTVDGTPRTVHLRNVYANPVVVCTPQYLHNTRPIVVRVSHVAATSFRLWLQVPGDLAQPESETVWYIVMNAGAYNVDSVKFEAQKYTSTVTDRQNRWNGQDQDYLNSYKNPVVIGQVMSANDARWSVFWCMGQIRIQPPHKNHLTTGKHVGEDNQTARANETVGFIVFEEGHGPIGNLIYDAQVRWGIWGVGLSPPYSASFESSFSSTPQDVLVSQAAMLGDNGSFAVVYGSPHATKSRAYVAVDEDTIGDSERIHVIENVGVVAFQNSGPRAAITGWQPMAP